MRAMSVDVVRIPTKGPGDVSGLIRLIETGKIIPSSILAVLGKTEGNGGVNDFTREYAMAALCNALSPHLGLTPRAVEDKIAFVMSGGTEGVLSPHLTVFARSFATDAPNGGRSEKRLSIGIAHTRDFLPEEIGRKLQIEETVKAVHLAMRDAGIDDPHDVHFVQIKCPLLTSERIEGALHRGYKTVTTGAYASMGYSRGASALGVAQALGEISGEIDESQVLEEWELYSSVASSSAGIELMHNVVIVMGNSPLSLSPFVIGHAVMRELDRFFRRGRGAQERRTWRSGCAVERPSGQRFCQGGGLAGRLRARLPPYHAGRFGCRFHASRSRRCRRIDRRIIRNRRRVCVRRRRAPGTSRRRPGRGDRTRIARTGGGW